MTIASLFEDEPWQWGLRGDPYLWREMRAHFEAVPLPAEPDELTRMLTEIFESLTGHSPQSDHPVRVERFCHGGMSSGMVSPPWWMAQGFPLLRSRHPAA